MCRKQIGTVSDSWCVSSQIPSRFSVLFGNLTVRTIKQTFRHFCQFWSIISKDPISSFTLITQKYRKNWISFISSFVLGIRKVFTKMKRDYFYEVLTPISNDPFWSINSNSDMASLSMCSGKKTPQPFSLLFLAVQHQRESSSLFLLAWTRSFSFWYFLHLFTIHLSLK